MNEKRIKTELLFSKTDKSIFHLGCETIIIIQKYEELALGGIILPACPMCLCLAKAVCRACIPFARNQISDLEHVHSGALIGTTKKVFRG